MVAPWMHYEDLRSTAVDGNTTSADLLALGYRPGTELLGRQLLRVASMHQERVIPSTIPGRIGGVITTPTEVIE